MAVNSRTHLGRENEVGVFQETKSHWQKKVQQHDTKHWSRSAWPQICHQPWDGLAMKNSCDGQSLNVTNTYII